MPEQKPFRPGAIRALPFALAAALGLLVLGAGGAAAQTYEIVNEPPPMPEAMRSGTATAPVSPRNALPVVSERTVHIGGEERTVREAVDRDMGFAVPDQNGGLIWFPAPVRPTPLAQADARELRLKIRELAAQLIAGMDPSLRGHVAIPTSFVNQEDFSQSSPLGRFIAEQLFHECNQRGFPVREYRLAPAVSVTAEGEFLLSREVPGISTQSKGAVFVVGTYFIDRQAVFINARLTRGDGTVLRTAQIILPASGITRRMLAGSGKALKTGTLPIHDFKTTTQPTNLTPFDRGEDIH